MARSLRSLSGSIAAAPTYRAIFAPHPKTSACHHPFSPRQPGLACDPHLNHARRASLTVWFTDEAVAAWRAEPRTTPGGQPRYSSLAITTALTMRTVFGLALRQTEGLIGSLVALLGLALAVPDHSTLSRRSKTLEVPPHRRLGAG